MKITHIKKPNFNLNVLQTKKFKTTRVEITFTNHLTKETATKRALLPYLLKAVTENYPTRGKMQIHLEDLYSASFSAGIKKVGLTQMITFNLSIINNKYTLNNEDLFTEGLDFINEVLFNPLFTEEIFQEEKRLLLEYFQGIYANKMRYTLRKTLEEMYKDEKYSVDANGTEEELKELSLDDCINAYHDMIHTDTININIVGDVDIDEVTESIESKLFFEPRQNNLILVDQSPKAKRNEIERFEHQDINQGKLVIGYQFPIYYQTEDYYKAVVLNTLVGGGPESLLFKRIREDLSLVYFIGSVYDNYKGTLVVYAGINQEEYSNVQNEITNVLEDVERRNYDDKFLTIAKKSIVSGLLQSFDSSSSLISRLNTLSLFDKELDVEELTDKINEVTKEDISRLIVKLKKDVSYLLRNDSLENNSL